MRNKITGFFYFFPINYQNYQESARSNFYKFSHITFYYATLSNLYYIVLLRVTTNKRLKKYHQNSFISILIFKTLAPNKLQKGSHTMEQTALHESQHEALRRDLTCVATTQQIKLNTGFCVKSSIHVDSCCGS